jgi:hypothetical protein
LSCDIAEKLESKPVALIPPVAAPDPEGAADAAEAAVEGAAVEVAGGAAEGTGVDAAPHAASRNGTMVPTTAPDRRFTEPSPEGAAWRGRFSH